MSSTSAMNTDLFLGFVDQDLTAELVEKRPGAVVVLDNLKPHLASGLREKLEAALAEMLDRITAADHTAGSNTLATTWL